MQINEYHGTCNRSKRSGGTSAIKYIVCHYTGGTGSARNNCIYFAGGNRNASADYFIDDSGIWEYNDPDGGYYTWHCGDGGGKYGITNSNSVGIETVNAGGAFSEAEIGHLAELVQSLMSKYGIAADHVVRHYDASRKSCPAGYVDEAAWSGLHSRITGGGATATAAAATAGTASSPSNPSAGLDVDGYWGAATITACQKALGTTQDGYVSGQNATDMSNIGGQPTSNWLIGSGGSQMVRALQSKVGAAADGYFGPNTCKALQNFLGTTADGVISKPSACVMELQRRLNAGTF